MIKRNKVNWKIPKGAELTELDKKVLYFQNKGHLVPTRELIKTPEQIEGIRRAGLLNTAVLDKVAENIKEGMSTAEIDKIVYDYTFPHVWAMKVSPKVYVPLSMKWCVTEFLRKKKYWKRATLSM